MVDNIFSGISVIYLLESAHAKFMYSGSYTAEGAAGILGKGSPAGMRPRDR